MGHRSETAFAELVRRPIDLVYSAALRMVCDPYLAQEVAQGTFPALAQSAARLAERAVLSGWLHGTARNLACKTVRAGVRRRAREQEAVAMNELLSDQADTPWEYVAPHLDAALAELTESDRDAVLLRYVERKSAREIADILGISDEAAQKRLNRAIERLRGVFLKRGVAVGASGLVALISTNAVQSAPVALTAAISTTVISGAAVSPSVAVAATKTIAMTTLPKSLVAVIAVVGVATLIVLHQRSAAKQRTADETSRQQAVQLADQHAENERLSALADKAAESGNQSNDLRRLRAKAATLQGATNKLPELQAENRRLRAAAARPDVEPSDSEKQEIAAKTIHLGS